nr:TM2 domain-containing protein [Streptomyces sp. CB02414]
MDRRAIPCAISGVPSWAPGRPFRPGPFPPLPRSTTMTVPPNPAAPYGFDPQGRPYSDKSKIVAGLLQIFLGGLGIGRFYVGSVGVGVAQLLTCGGLGFWALIDGILFLTSKDRTDKEGRVLRG